MRIKKFRLAEGFVLAFMAAVTIVASTADWVSPYSLSHESVPSGYLAALVELRSIEALMATTAIDQYLYLLDDAFEGGRWHSLIGNLENISAADWEWIPPGGSRLAAGWHDHIRNQVHRVIRRTRRS